MALTLNKTGITTGNTVEAYHVTQSIDAFTGTAAYDITLSGSLQVTGSVAINGLTNPSKTNVLTYDTTTGQVFYTASNALPDQMVNTSSFVTNDQTGSFITDSQTGSFSTGSSYVSSSILTPGVVGGNEITFYKGDGTTHTQTINTGSSYISSSILNPGVGGGNEITFNLSDGTTQTQIINTGSGGDFMTWVTRSDADSAAYNIPDSNYGMYITKDNTANIDFTLPSSPTIGSRVKFIVNPTSTSTAKYKIKNNTGQKVTLFEDGATTIGTSGFIRFSESFSRQAIELTCTIDSSISPSGPVEWAITSWFPYTQLSSSGKIELF